MLHMNDDLRNKTVNFRVEKSKKKNLDCCIKSLPYFDVFKSMTNFEFRRKIKYFSSTFIG